jgi:ATP adenylyltransferase
VSGYLFNPEKIKYVTGCKPKVECILCSIRDKDPDVTLLEIARTAHSIVTVNLYPFNPGHLMIFPLKHCTDICELTNDEAVDIHQLTVRSVEALKSEFNPAGFNLGYNMGVSSGASIPHLHLHIVPRYHNEVGFIDVLAGDRVIVVDPVEIMRKIKKRFCDLIPPAPFSDAAKGV